MLLPEVALPRQSRATRTKRRERTSPHGAADPDRPHHRDGAGGAGPPRGTPPASLESRCSSPRLRCPGKAGPRGRNVVNERRHTARLILTGHIIETARVGQAPPAVPPPRVSRVDAPPRGCVAPAKPGHADETS